MWHVKRLHHSFIIITSFVFLVPNPVLDLVATPKSNTSVEVSWTDPRGVQPHYKYSVQAYNSSELVSNETTRTNSTVLTNLSPGRGYNISVTTKTAGSESSVEQTFSYTSECM